jgi:F-type H+-transporting ATPase subunit a
MFLFAEGEHHTPLIVQFINQYLGEPVHKFQIAYTEPMWNKYVFARFGTSAGQVFGPYTVENAIPWYTIMFVIACILTVIIIAIFKGKLSEHDPDNGQLSLEAGYLTLQDMAANVIGTGGARYVPVVATFAILILVCNLMGMFPLFMSPTASVNVTFAFGLASFVYFNYIGIKENGLKKYITHFAGPDLPWYMFPITILIFVIELVSMSIRPLTLGVRLFANMFADEQLYAQISNLAPPYTHYGFQLVLLALGLFVAVVQTLVFTLLSMIYINLALPHHEHAAHEDEHDEPHGEVAVAHA